MSVSTLEGFFVAKDILVLNLGADKQFKQALTHVTALVQTYAETKGNADVFVATTRSSARIVGLLDEPIGLLHVMGHGEPSGSLQSGKPWWRNAYTYDVSDLAEWVAMTGRPLKIDAILLDGCSTFSTAWRAKVSTLLPAGHEAVVIGTSRPVGWDEASTYVGAFYPSLLRRKFPRQAPKRRAAVLDAHERATIAYESVLQARSPFRCDVIVGPS